MTLRRRRIWTSRGPRLPLRIGAGLGGRMPNGAAVICSEQLTSTRRPVWSRRAERAASSRPSEHSTTVKFVGRSGGSSPELAVTCQIRSSSAENSGRWSGSNRLIASSPSRSRRTSAAPAARAPRSAATTSVLISAALASNPLWRYLPLPNVSDQASKTSPHAPGRTFPLTAPGSCGRSDGMVIIGVPRVAHRKYRAQDINRAIRRGQPRCDIQRWVSLDEEVASHGAHVPFRKADAARRA